MKTLELEESAIHRSLKGKILIKPKSLTQEIFILDVLRKHCEDNHLNFNEFVEQL